MYAADVLYAIGLGPGFNDKGLVYFSVRYTGEVVSSCCCAIIQISIHRVISDS